MNHVIFVLLYFIHVRIQLFGARENDDCEIKCTMIINLFMCWMGCTGATLFVIGIYYVHEHSCARLVIQNKTCHVMMNGPVRTRLSVMKCMRLPCCLNSAIGQILLHVSFRIREVHLHCVEAQRAQMPCKIQGIKSQKICFWTLPRQHTPYQ